VKRQRHRQIGARFDCEMQVAFFASDVVRGSMTISVAPASWASLT